MHKLRSLKRLELFNYKDTSDSPRLIDCLSPGLESLILNSSSLAVPTCERMMNLKKVAIAIHDGVLDNNFFNTLIRMNSESLQYLWICIPKEVYHNPNLAHPVADFDALGSTQFPQLRAIDLDYLTAINLSKLLNNAPNLETFRGRILCKVLDLKSTELSRLSVFSGALDMYIGRIFVRKTCKNLKDLEIVLGKQDDKHILQYILERCETSLEYLKIHLICKKSFGHKAWVKFLPSLIEDMGFKFPCLQQLEMNMIDAGVTPDEHNPVLDMMKQLFSGKIQVESSGWLGHDGDQYLHYDYNRLILQRKCGSHADRKSRHYLAVLRPTHYIKPFSLKC
eukprot:TRINITY_DN41806_c0_g1_i1.p1 TRINITY_DN41806_c0_g1~~TRINITY_DN41806_c0_g1_i1.p1  ORF type:complete len:337 (-),score=41.82 TRINITY_DN41806_c0_g1_i1:31-1041(-)